jgi:molybdopterin molybdotransferase
VRPDRPLEPGRYIRRQGEDLREGAVLAAPGEPLTIQRITALASAGVGEVAVHRPASVHVITTGSELLPVGAPPEPGKVHESNGLTLSLLCDRAGAQVTDHGVVRDDPQAIRAAVQRGLDAADVLLVTGGVSVGPHDHVKPAFEALGVEEVFWRVRIKPGKPLWFGRRGDTLVFGLPGNPLSSLVGFLAFIEPVLRRLHGEREAAMTTVPARLTGEAGPSDGRTTFYTAALRPGPDGVLEATPTERQGSHMTGALGESDGFVIVAGTIAAGDLAPAIPLS